MILPKRAAGPRLLCAWLFACIIPARAAGVSPAGGQDWDIVVSGDAIPSEQYAAREFQHFFEQATGTRLPIRSTSEADHHVFIGPSGPLKSSVLGLVMDRVYGEEELRIVTGDDHIAITGGRPRGVLYGVYQFLEDSLGVRFLTAGLTHVPPCPADKNLAPADRSYTPPLAYRFYLKAEVMDDPAFAVRRRQNGADPNSPHKVPEEMGGIAPKQFFLHNNHGLHSVGPDQHPEYYCLSGGKRMGAQICMSHPDVRRLVWQSIEQRAPNLPPNYVIALAQNDAGHPCGCPRCNTIRHEGDSPAAVAELFSLEAVRAQYGRDNPLGMVERPAAGPPSVSTVRYVNHLAEKLEAIRPDVRIGTMAYSYTMMPPRKTRVRDNVIIQFATYHSCILHGYDDPACPTNRQSTRYLQGWGTLCEHLVMWFYDHNHQDVLSVVPNLRIQADAIRFFVANNARGIFTQGTPRNNGFSDLRAYLLTALHWNPDLDSEALIDEFLALYYGAKPAALIRQWLDLAHDSVDYSEHTNIGYQPRHIGLDPALGDIGLRLFEKAMAGAESDEIRERIEKVSITAHRLGCEPLMWNAGWAGMTAAARKVPIEDVSYSLTEADKKDQLARYRRMLELCEKHGINQYREGILLDHATAGIRTYLGLGEI